MDITRRRFVGSSGAVVVAFTLFGKPDEAFAANNTGSGQVAVLEGVQGQNLLMRLQSGEVINVPPCDFGEDWDFTPGDKLFVGETPDGVLAAFPLVENIQGSDVAVVGDKITFEGQPIEITVPSVRTAAIGAVQDMGTHLHGLLLRNLNTGNLRLFGVLNHRH